MERIKIERRTILEDLQEAAIQCEGRFPDKRELATEYDKRVIRICETFESVFNHGLKKNKSLFNKITMKWVFYWSTLFDLLLIL